jgi:hypothetical protein
MKRSKSNLVQPVAKPVEPTILDADSRRELLSQIHLWRCFDQYLTALMEMQ